MSNAIMLALRPEDAEPILREAAREAAEFGGLLDHVTRRVERKPYRGHGEAYEVTRKNWQARFAKAKRMVEAFGVDVESTSEAETVTVDYPYEGGKRKPMDVAGVRFNYVTGSQPNYKKPYPVHWRGVHAEAAIQAADRVVRRWRQTIAADVAA